MKPRPLDYGCGLAAAAAAGCAGWAWRPRPRGGGRSPGVSPKCSNSPNSAAAAGAVHSEHHRRGVSGVLLRPVELPGTGYGSEVEARIERVIFACRFMTFLGIGGLLLGSVPCFLKGSVHVMNAFVDYYLHGGGKLILMLLEAIEMFLIGTVTFVLGIGLYELFISTIDSSYGSNLFGLFSLPDRPKWVEIKSLDDLKTKLGHVIVLVLLVGIFEKSKRFDEELLLLLLQLMLQFYDYIQTKRPHISCVCGCQTLSFELSAPAHARKLEVMRAPIRSLHPPCTPRSVLQETATQTESTTPGHSPSIGHNSPPN